MSFTKQLSVNSATPTAITAQSVCASIRVMENRGVAGWPTSDLLVLKPSNVSQPVRIPGGSSYTFAGTTPNFFFFVGQIVGYVQTVAGTTTLDQDEDNP